MKTTDTRALAGPDLRRRAVEALGRLGDTSTETLQVLRELATNNPDSDLRRQAAEALGRLGDTSTETLQVLREQASCLKRLAGDPPEDQKGSLD